MKYLILLVALATSALSQLPTYKTPGVNGENVVPSTFRAALGVSSDGKYYKPITSVAFMGDSITALAYGSSPEYFTHQSFFKFFSKKEIPIIDNGSMQSFGVSGAAAGEWLSGQIPVVTALANKPSHAITMIGTNDIARTISIPTTISNIAAGASALRAAGIEPMFLIFPGSVGSFDELSHNENLANAIIEWCALNNIFVCDSRTILNDPTLLGRDSSGGLFDNLHPNGGWSAGLGRLLAEKLEPALVSIPSMISASSPINTNPFITAALGTLWPPASGVATSNLTYTNRPDGVSGRWARLEMSYTQNRPITIGSGNSAVNYTAKAPWTNKQIFVDTKYAGNSTGLTIEVFPSSTSVYIRVGLKVVGGVSTANEVAAAINAHAVASTYVTAAAGGDGTGWANGTAPGTWLVVGNDPLATTEIGLLQNDQVRCLVELRVLSGELSALNLRVEAFTNPDVGSDVYVGTFHSTSVMDSANPQPMTRGASLFFATGWKSVGSNGAGGPQHHRFKPVMTVGGRDCVLEIGRIFIQRRAAP